MPAPNPHPTPTPEPTAADRPAPAGPAHLRLLGLTDDGAHLRLVDEEGSEHLLAVDDRLRATLGTHLGTPPRPSTTPAPRDGRGMEKTMESTLRPRDIQARIRAGEAPEAVAEAAQTSVERIMPFAAPVLAEREHVAQRAQRSSVRRAEGAAPPAGARTLGDAVATTLRARNVDPESVAWDAWRREDGRWTLSGGYETSERSGTAALTFDPPGNYVTLDNDDARWLVGEAIATPVVPGRPDDLEQARQRRLSAAGEPTPDASPATSPERTAYADQLPLGGDETFGADALDLVSEQPVEAFLDTAPPTYEAVVEQEAALREEAADAAAEESDPAEPPTRRPVKKTRGRASVPSWDEIMFGGGDTPR